MAIGWNWRFRLRPQASALAPTQEPTSSCERGRNEASSTLNRIPIGHGWQSCPALNPFYLDASGG